MEFNGVNCIYTPGFNCVINVKNPLEFSKDYSDKVRPSMLHHVDKNTGAVMQKYTTLQLDGNAQTIAPTDVATYNDGFAERQKVLEP